MLQLQNESPFAPAINVLPDRDGVDTLYVLVKATLVLLPKLALAAVQLPPTRVDAYYGDPALSSLKAASEMHIAKPGTDVLLVGQAWAPRGEPVHESQVSLAVGERRKSIRVSGDRVWQANGVPSLPEPFVSMPLVWERSFGGLHRSGDRVHAEERNPVGVGFAGPRKADEMQGMPVPNLEDPSAPLDALGDRSLPACLAPIAASWLPRRRFAGTYDAAWRRERAPYLPKDFDPRFLQCAVPEFAFDRYLQGGEPIELRGVHPEGPIAFALPAAPLEIEVRIDGSVEHPVAHLETVLIEPDENRLCLSWRAALPCDRKVLKVEKVVTRMRRAGAGA